MEHLNALDTAQFRAHMLTCCASQRFADAMTQRRPFASVEAMEAAANEEWSKLDEEDWLEAFAAHPRIGDRKKAETQKFASGEQAGAASASAAVLEELRSLNEEYERTFPFIYLVCATGKSAEEMLAILKSRLGNPKEEEVKVAAGEQAKITALRLRKLVDSVAAL